MRDKEYQVKTLRLAEDVWEQLKKEQKASGLSWNLFVKGLLDEEKARS